MGERITLRVFKMPDEQQFRRTFEDVVCSNGGEIAWNVTDRTLGEDCRISHCGGIHSVYLPYLGGAEFLLCHKVGEAFGGPWMELRIQEGSHWEYSLFHGGRNVDNFSTLPEYWDDDQARIAASKGQPELLARIWEIPLARIDRYVRDWGYRQIDEDSYETVLTGKAYEADEHEYGMAWQMLDFLRTLGGIDPMTLKTGMHRLRMPPAERLRGGNEAGSESRVISDK